MVRALPVGRRGTNGKCRCRPGGCAERTSDRRYGVDVAGLNRRGRNRAGESGADHRNHGKCGGDDLRRYRGGVSDAPQGTLFSCAGGLGAQRRCIRCAKPFKDRVLEYRAPGDRRPVVDFDSDAVGGLVQLRPSGGASARGDGVGRPSRRGCAGTSFYRSGQGARAVGQVDRGSRDRPPRCRHTELPQARRPRRGPASPRRRVHCR